MTIAELEYKLAKFKMSEYYDKDLQVKLCLEQIPLSDIDDSKFVETHDIDGLRFVKGLNQVELVSRI